VQVGRYHGFLYRPRIFITDVRNRRQAAEHGIRPGWPRFTQLFVQLPAGGGKMRALVIGARQLSDAALIQIAANGLAGNLNHPGIWPSPRASCQVWP